MSTHYHHHSETHEAPVFPVTPAPLAREFWNDPLLESPSMDVQGSTVEVLLIPSQGAISRTSETARSLPSSQGSAVHVAPNVSTLLMAAPGVTPPETFAAADQRGLNEVLQRALIVGLGISIVLTLVGVGLELFSQGEVLIAVPDGSGVITNVVTLRPSGILALGLLVLITTPLLRVFSAFGTFAYARDWRFAGISALVLMIVIAGLLLGHG